MRTKAIDLTPGVQPDGTRGVAGLLIAVTDGLKGMPEALAATSPATTLQTGIVHLFRNSLDTPAGRITRRGGISRATTPRPD